MKMISIILMLIFTVNTIAVAPYGLNGQNQSTTYPNVHQVPNKQITNLGGINALIETGNNNLLENPSFEHATVQTGWTSSAGTIAAESSVVVHGKKSLKISLSSQALDLSQNSTLYQAQFADGVQGLAAIKIKTSVSGLRVCAQKAGTINSNLCVNVNADNKWGYYKVPFILGGTSNGIEIDSNSVAVTGDVYFDEAFVGAYGLSTDVPSVKTQYSQLESTATFTGNVTISGALSDTNGSGLYSYDSATGIYTALDDINVVMSVYCRTSTAPAGHCGIRTSTSTFDDEQTFIQTINTFISASKTFYIQKGGTFSAQKGTGATSIDRANVSVLASKEVNTSIYSSNNADTDWGSCGHTTSSFTGFGTVTGIETQCKRQGSDLLMKGKFTTGTVTATEARLSLPVWSGIQLVSKNSTIIPSLQYTGDLVQAFNSTTIFRNSVLIEPSVSYMTFGIQSSTANAITKATGSAGFSNTSASSFSARIPIEGWENSNLIIGQFNGLESCADSYECESLFTAQISSTGVVTGENIDWINGNCSMTLGAASCTLKTGLAGSGSNLTNAMNCGVTGVAATRIPIIASSGSSTVVFELANTGGASTAGNMSVYCQKQGVDYVGKTARAVASDQNWRTPGVTNSVVYSASISSTGSISSEFGDFINGNCVVTSTNVFTCSFNSGVFASSPVCQVSAIGVSGSSRSIYIAGVPSSTSVTYLTYNTSGPTAVALNAQLTCHGISP